ncbi:MAG: T9SS type A sorting domain-containing protein [Saprospiraceae bacterium]|nr:T9SS type A sorting domain-containing protein [Saprospiraceae bacterium]
MKKYFYVLCLLISTNAVAQAPVSETIHVNSVEAKVWSNGALFGYGSEKGFKVPATDDNDSIKIATFRRVVPWIGGYDDFGNLKLACIAPTGLKSDFAPGLLGVEGYNEIHKVTKAEIQAHINDFADNGVIDNPIPSIINWPGTLLLPQFSQWQGLDSTVNVAPFYDWDYNYSYNPLDGDFPLPDVRGPQELLGVPEEILFFAFHDIHGLHEASSGHYMDMQIFCTVWAYSCPEEPALDNSIFVSLEYMNNDLDPLDSLHFGLLMNFEIGADNDDFIGCIPGDEEYYVDEIFYGYNGDSIDQNGFNDATPVIAMFLVGYEPYDPFYPTPSYEPATYFMQVGNSQNTTPFATRYPQTPQQYFKYLTGHWLDGTPLRTGGNGYHPQDTSEAEKLIYPGDPTDTTGWSEPTAGNLPGLRRGLASYTSPRMNPGARQRRSFCFTWARQMDAINTTKAALEQIQVFKDKLSKYWNGWEDPPVTVRPGCFSLNSILTVPPNTYQFNISPNPTTGTCHLSYPDAVLKDITITDLQGKTVFQQHTISTSEITLDLTLPSGMYFLTATTSDNKRLTQKLIISQ